MGLTFQQKFYYLPDEMFLVVDERSRKPIAILEKTDDNIDLKIELKYPCRVFIIDINNLVLKGYELRK